MINFFLMSRHQVEERRRGKWEPDSSRAADEGEREGVTNEDGHGGFIAKKLLFRVGAHEGVKSGSETGRKGVGVPLKAT
jgi:hypothetical protein